MEKFLGVLFCGGRGVRLGAISDYVSKPLLPVYDRPCFMFGLELLKKSRLIDSIIVLSNKDNDKTLQKAGFPTLVQDDKIVKDMFTGWEFIKKKTGTLMHGVLMPSDNISEINADNLIKTFINKKSDIVFSIKSSIPRKKLRQMGNFKPDNRTFLYKPEKTLPYGVIAPYVVRNSFKPDTDKAAFESSSAHYLEYNGPWLDIGDKDSFAEAVAWRRKQLRQS